MNLFTILLLLAAVFFALTITGTVPVTPDISGGILLAVLAVYLYTGGFKAITNAFQTFVDNTSQDLVPAGFEFLGGFVNTLTGGISGLFQKFFGF